MKIQSINPFTEEVVQEFDALKFEECSAAVDRALEAAGRWRRLSVADRCGYIKRAAEVLRTNKRRYAAIITQEMGKPIKQSLGEIEKCAWVCDFYAEASEDLLDDELIPTEAAKSYVTFEPLGVVLGIMPWNFPFWQVFRYAVPALAAGNVCLLKHASNVPRTAMEIERLLSEAGLPPNVFQTLLAGSGDIMKLLEEDRVHGVSLTGSVAAGSQVGAAAGKHIRKLVLELGGSDPFIVLEDADLDRAAQTALSSRFLNAGQSCIAAKRLIVKSSVAKELQDRLLAGLKDMKIGDPMDEETFIGPVAKKEFLKDLQEQLDDARDKGAEIILGPEPPQGKGYFFRPAVVMNATSDMKVLTEEVFGPILPIVVCDKDEEIIRIANDTEFGLGASLWSMNTEKAERMARKIDSGFIAINDMVKSDPRLPFGGVKKSGVGRELSHYGLKEFTNVKTVVVQAN